jgi:hypothetical protein
MLFKYIESLVIVFRAPNPGEASGSLRPGSFQEQPPEYFGSSRANKTTYLTDDVIDSIEPEHIPDTAIAIGRIGYGLALSPCTSSIHESLLAVHEPALNGRCSLF